MDTGKYFRQVNLPEQKQYDDGVIFPVVLSPNTNFDCNFTAEAKESDFKEAIKAEKQWIESLVDKYGVILFRGFPVKSASDFNDVVEAFGFPEIEYVGGRAPRTKVVGRVYTANESPPENRVPFHHEMSYVPDAPSKLFFFCEQEPGKGGQTPLVLSHIIYDKMKEKYPEFIAEVEEHGVKNVVVMGDEDDSSNVGGRGWKSAYMTNDKKVAEERAAKQGAKLEWMHGNAVKVTTGPLPAFRFDKKSQHKTWFNNIAYTKPVPLNGINVDDHDTYIELGNGGLVSDQAQKECSKIMEEECVVVPWKNGDVMLVNNLIVLHARQPLLKPPRRVLASLCK
ncbi:clavaminate synthase-like protein At3g21360 [Rutidosis leptorrhynchoides]|uniref:clavaminate synthase-like protein At3g21360 n=1 Tax=Rutidosis leptorrhynchoides TaxID=125765 RepID=UPI003A992347